MDGEKIPQEDELKVDVADDHSFMLQIFEGGDPDGPVVLVTPAMGVRGVKYRKAGLDLAGRGITVAVGDLRGHGTSSVKASRDCNWGYRETLEWDMPAALTALEQRFPGRPIYLLGHSLGGQLSCLFTAANTHRVAGLILVASCSVYWRRYPMGGVMLRLLLAVIGPILAWYGYFPGKRFGFAHLEAADVMRDWVYQARTGRYRVAGSDRDYEALLGEMARNILVISVEGDTFAPPRAVDHLCDKLKRAHIARRNLAIPGQKPGRSAHFNWLSRFDAFGGEIHNWLNGRR